MKTLSRVFVLVLVVCLSSALSLSQTYQKPPKVIQDVLDAPEFPIASVSPAKDKIALFEPVAYPPVADLAEPILRLAGLRISPGSNSRSTQRYLIGLKLLDIGSGLQKQVGLPDTAKLISPQWSSDGRYIAVGNIAENGVELWIIETGKAAAVRIEGVYVNTVFGGFSWMPDGKSLLVNTVPANRGAAPEVSEVPRAPSIQETSGRPAAIRTYQDLLKSPGDERRFEYYATSQLAVVDIDGTISKVGEPSIFQESDSSPDGKYLLVARVEKPFSYLFPVWSFGRKVEIWNRNGEMVREIANIPLQDNLPVDGVTTGPRNYGWLPTEAASLMWVEALDGGDPRRKAEFRDKLVLFSAPFSDPARDLINVGQRYSGRLFGENRGTMWFYDYDRDSRRRRLYEARYDRKSEIKLISDLNVRDRYNDIGTPVMKTLRNGRQVILNQDSDVFLTGRGSTPNGDLPFLRIRNGMSGSFSELFRSGPDSYESVVDVISTGAITSFVTRKESATEPPDLYLRYVCAPLVKCKPAPDRKLTEYRDPTPQLRGITKELVKYKRNDGVDLSFTLYLPEGYRKGTRLPALLWAYPLEYTDTATAGQVSGSTNRFTTISGYSHLFLLTQGYAILHNATVPIVGDPLTVNDTFIEQLVNGAQAAVDKAAEMGVVDPDRVAVGGHSYGAFMTAHLLANSDIFRAGIARSGAYNRTLTPFGFQSERRSFWEAPESYYTLSPFMRANRINEPMLMIHGQADNNSGTYPMQSERMFAAIRGNGGTARLVMLPFESHGYRARQSVEHVLWEQIRWMDIHVKNAKPRKE